MKALIAVTCCVIIGSAGYFFIQEYRDYRASTADDRLADEVAAKVAAESEVRRTCQTIAVWPEAPTALRTTLRSKCAALGIGI